MDKKCRDLFMICYEQEIQPEKGYKIMCVKQMRFTAKFLFKCAVNTVHYFPDVCHSFLNKN